MLKSKILIIQTAFIGDVILTTPMVSVLNKNLSNVHIDTLAIPEGGQVWQNNPAIQNIIIYDKKGKEKGFVAFIKLLIKLRLLKYDWVISPHRSLRSALLAYFSGAKKRTTFDKSTLSGIFYNDVKKYLQIHEIDRNLSLIGGGKEEIVRPEIYPSFDEKEKVELLLKKEGVLPPYITIAPGSVWNTKRWPVEKFRELIKSLNEFKIKIVLVGGEDDKDLGKILASNNDNCINLVGKLNIRESYYLIKSSQCLVTNDSAPLHLGSAAGIPVVAIFGATIPGFGFAPYGNELNRVIEIKNLDCRPCGIHGGKDCPKGHFRCMLDIDVQGVVAALRGIIH